MPAGKVIEDFVKITTELSEAARANVPHELDIEYGSGARQKYDLYGTNLKSESGIVVFIHGGYWQSMEKDSAAVLVKPLYDQGFKVIVADYDLAPTVTIAHIINEIEELASHVLEEAVRLASTGVWIAGHSAGAHLASALLNPIYQKTLSVEQKQMLRGLFLVSGVYEVAPLVPTNINSILELTTGEAEKVSTHNFFNEKQTCKLLITLGSHESPEFYRQAEEAHEKSEKAGTVSELHVAENSDHFNIIEDLHDASLAITKKFIAFIQNP